MISTEYIKNELSEAEKQYLLQSHKNKAIRLLQQREIYKANIALLDAELIKTGAAIEEIERLISR